MELATGFLKGKVDEKKAIQEVRIKKIQSDSDWENTMADATKSSWKDEYLIILLTLNEDEKIRNYNGSKTNDECYGWYERTTLRKATRV